MSEVLDTSDLPASTGKNLKIIKKTAVIAALVVVFFGILTCAMTYKNLGYTSTFYTSWATSFLLSVLVTAPAGSVIATLMHLYINRVFSEIGEKGKNVLFGIHMAIAMEAIMACATAANNVGFESLSAFFGGWLEAFSVALPLGLVLSVALTVTLKPRLVKFLAS